MSDLEPRALSIAEEIERLRARVHRMVDTQQDIAIRINEHKLLLDMLTTTVRALESNAATKEQLAAASTLVSTQIINLQTLMTTKLDHGGEKVEGLSRNQRYVAYSVFVPVIAVAAWACGSDGPTRAASAGQAEPARSGRAGRRRAVARVVLGAALPVLAVVGYYAAHGMLFELVDGVALFNLTLMENEATLYANVRALQQAMLLFYKPAGLVIAVGLFALVPLALWRWRRFGAALARDPFFCVLASFPLPVLWSLLDFQGGPDFFVFLPYAALGFAWLVGVGLERALDLAELDVIGRAAVGALAVLAVWSSGWILMDALGPARLGDQRRALAAFEQRHPDARIASVGAPQAMVLLERTNPTRYGFVMRGIANHVEAHHPGGYEGWLAALARDADVLLTTRSAAHEMGPREQRWQAWLEQHYALEGQVHGPVQAWVRRP
jgi:hypothetical protein